MAAVGLVLGFVSRRVGGRHGFRHEGVVMAANIGSLALGVRDREPRSLIVIIVDRIVDRIVHRIGHRARAVCDLRPHGWLPHAPPARLPLTPCMNRGLR